MRKALWVGLLLAGVGCVGLQAGGSNVDLSGLPVIDLEKAKLLVSVLGFGGTIATILLAIRQYRRAEQWRRAEFIAREVKDFENSQVVRNTLSMIDWGARRVNLRLRQNPEDRDLIRVTREMQWKALLPHTVKGDSPFFRGHTLDGEAPDTDAEHDSFTSIEARIRDSYDLFLDQLQRFANFVRSELVTAEELRPYLAYWSAQITSPDGSNNDIAWKCALLTYIDFYEFRGVQDLFKAFGSPIEPRSSLFCQILGQLKNADLKEALERSLREKKQRAVAADA